ncbi:zinc finger CW-type PWWP domain protein 1 [Eublepharis macularius]|uniref:Zinc finger CW-type PWWP domain protein 1 n=1 Tax=Eublepharis macularius TaxID=481883 RepID=A0AA97LCU3_EUBMA|nr:zinc finger CW-type PWWP domain protein 1 [Eublepharis macularius]
MASQNKNDELRKVSKRLFAPPLTKPYAPFAEGEPEIHRKREDGQTIPVPLNHSEVNGSSVKPIKAHYSKVNIRSQDKKQKRSTKEEKEAKHEEVSNITKNVDRKEDGYLTDSVFEEIVECVLKKSLAECMEDFKKIAPSVEERSLGRETLDASLPTREAVSGKGSRDEGEAMLLEAKQQELQPEKKIHSKLSLEEDKHETSWCVVWVQCSYPACEKWRRLSSDVDPSVLPENWSCSQNPDLQYNSCSIPEEMWSGSENEVVYAVYIPGSIVWAKQYGYPWWPGMVEADPDIGEYFLFSSRTDSLPSKYHVTFFGDSVTRAWISASMLRNFSEPNAEENCLAKPKRKSDRKNLESAQKMAKEAEQINIPERIRTFGFCSRFNGKDLKDLDNLTCHSRAKKTQDPGGGNESAVTSNKSLDKLFPGTSVVRPDGKHKKKTYVKRDKKSSSLSKKSQKKATPTKAVTEPKASKPEDDQKGPKKSFVVPRYKDTEAKRPSSCTDSSSANLLPSDHPIEKGSLDQVKTYLEAENNLVLTKVTMSHEELDELRAFGADEEEIFGSQEMAVFTEEKHYCPEDFSSVLFEE